MVRIRVIVSVLLVLASGAFSTNVEADTRDTVLISRGARIGRYAVGCARHRSGFGKT